MITADILAHEDEHVEIPDGIDQTRIVLERSTERFATIRIAPLQGGYGTTLGNALRRVLLSSLEGAAVTSIKIADVYHEFSYPEQMLAAMRKSLTPNGAIVLVEYRAEDENVPIKPEHKMSKEQIMKELIPNGFKLVKQFDKLPWQHMMWFGRDDAVPALTSPDSANPVSKP